MFLLYIIIKNSCLGGFRIWVIAVGLRQGLPSFD
jgi:hypothetical protein